MRSAARPNARSSRRSGELVEIRRQMDVEAWLHRLGRTWLVIHGPASWALIVLVVVHVWLSVRYGGY